MRTTNRMHMGVAILAAVLLASCSAQSRRILCDGPLTPINSATPAVPTTAPVQSDESR